MGNNIYRRQDYPVKGVENKLKIAKILSKHWGKLHWGGT